MVGHAGNGAGEDLQVAVRPDRRPHLVLALERVLTDVEVGCLVASSTAELEVADLRFLRRELHGGQDVLQAGFATERALKPVAEGA